MIVVLGSIQNDRLRGIRTKQHDGDTVSDVKHRHDNSTAVLERARVPKSIIPTIMHKEKAPIYKSSRRKAPKKKNTENLPLQTSASFCYTTRALALVSAIT